MGFVANFVRFRVVQKTENRLRFNEVTESLKVETFLRHSVVRMEHGRICNTFNTRVDCFKKHRQSRNACSGVRQFRIRNSNFTLFLSRASSMKCRCDVSRTAKKSRVSYNLLTLCFRTSTGVTAPVKRLFDDDDFALPALWLERFKLTVLFHRI